MCEKYMIYQSCEHVWFYWELLGCNGMFEDLLKEFCGIYNVI